MRTITFRAKTVNGNDWVESMTIAHGTIKRKAHDIFMEISENKWVGVKKETLSQFTGFTDKKGIKIFEGDILKTETNYYGKKRERIEAIQFNDEIENDSFGEPATAGYCIHGSDWEVIGNIHDNPELLK